MIIGSDIHLREESAETVFNEVLPGLIQAAISLGHSTVGLLGDILHFRYKVEVRLLNQLRDILKAAYEEHQIFWNILPGNHDQYEIGGRNALEVLGDIEGVTVFTEPAWTMEGLWIPYRKNHDDILAALAMNDPFKKRRKFRPVCFIHHGVKDAWMNDHIQNTEGLPAKAFKQFPTVFSGHYHRQHKVGNVVYVGSPYQTKADEASQPKGFIVITDGMEQWWYEQRDWGKKYHYFDVESEDLNFDGIDPRDEVRVRTAAHVNPEKVAAKLIEAGIQNHVVTPEQEALQARLDVPENAGLETWAQAFVDAQETDLDKQRLMQVFTEVTA